MSFHLCYTVSQPITGAEYASLTVLLFCAYSKSSKQFSLILYKHRKSALFRCIAATLILTHACVSQIVIATKNNNRYWRELTQTCVVKLTVAHWELSLLRNNGCDISITVKMTTHSQILFHFSPHYFIQITTDQGRISSAICVGDIKSPFKVA